MRSLWRRYGLFGVFVFWICSKMLEAAPRPTDVVAEVDGFKITVADVQKKLAQIAPNHPSGNEQELKREAANEAINEHLVKLRAASLSLDNDTAFMGEADNLLAQAAAREIFNRSVAAVVVVSDSEVVEHYRENPENYQQPAWVHAAHLLIAPVKDTTLITDRQRQTGWWADTEEKAKEIADSLYRMIQAGAPFDTLAREWSQDMASGADGGDLGFFSPGRMVPAFDSVAFRLPIASVSPPVKTQYGFHLIKVFSRQEKRTAPLSDSLKALIWQQITNDKMLKRSYAFLDSLQEKAGLKFNEGIFDRPDSALRAEKIWAAVSGYGDTVWSDRYAAQLAAARSMLPKDKPEREYKMQLLKELMNPLLLRRTARDMKIEEGESYRAQREQIFKNEAISRIYKEASVYYRPTEEETRAYYQAHKADFFQGESLSVHVQQMVFKTKKEAERVLQELQSGGDFALLARKYFPGDTDVSQEAFDLGFISPPAMPKNFFSVAETLTIGAVSQPVRTAWGYHLMRVVARRPDLNYETARPRIVSAIRKAKQDERKQKWEADLRAGHRISIREQVLRGIPFEPPRNEFSE